MINWLTILFALLGLAAGYGLSVTGQWMVARRGLTAASPAAASGLLRRPAVNSAAALVTAALFAFMHLKFGAWAWESAAVGMLLAALSVLIAVTDLTAKIIPNGALLAFGAVLLVAAPLAGGEPLWSYALGAVCGSGLLLAIHILTSGRGMGMGDVKLLAVLGWVTGFPGVLLVIFIASFIGAAAGLTQKAMSRNKGRSTLAFGPYLAIGAIIVYTYGKEILEWYLTNLIQIN